MKSKCPICPKREKSRKLLAIHEYKYHRNNRYRYLCPLCGDGFTRPGNARQHLTRSHAVPRNLQGVIERVEIGKEPLSDARINESLSDSITSDARVTLSTSDARLDARIVNDARVFSDARILGDARISDTNILNNARILSDARLTNDVTSDARILSVAPLISDTSSVRVNSIQVLEKKTWIPSFVGSE